MLAIANAEISAKMALPRSSLTASTDVFVYSEVSTTFAPDTAAAWANPPFASIAFPVRSLTRNPTLLRESTSTTKGVAASAAPSSA